MKSKVLSFAEYDQVDISMYKKVFKLDEKAYKKEIDFIKNKNSIWEETGEVTYGAFIVCDMESANPFFNRENLKIMVGQGFFHKKLEAMCVGLKKGTAGVLDVDGEKVTVTVRSIQQKKSPVITDEMIKDLGIEGVSNVEQYEAHLIREQKKKIAENEGYEAVQYVMDKVFEASTFDLKKADWKEMTDHEIKRLKAISREQGLNLETMTRTLKGRCRSQAIMNYSQACRTIHGTGSAAIFWGGNTQKKTASDIRWSNTGTIWKST